MCQLHLALLIVFLFGYVISDDSFPPYLRGLNWYKVEEHLRVDLRLSKSVAPTHYVMDLSVNVRGDAGALISDFNGSVYIYLDIIKPVDHIELHSKGLIIIKAQIFESLALSKPINVSRISVNEDRETITVHTNRTISQDEKFILKITYRGMARMDEYGLYENWDPKFNKSLDSNGPFVLASNNFPTGSRTWFPCFDESDKRATFELRVNHTSGLNVYSNTEVERTENVNEGRTLTVFEKSRPLSTHQVAMSVNHLSIRPLTVKGFKNVQLLSTNNLPKYMNGENDWRVLDIGADIPEFLIRSLEAVGELVEGVVQNDKLDIIILEGTWTFVVQPGLITIGRYNFRPNNLIKNDIRNLTQLITGNLISLRQANQKWLNEEFSYVLMNETETEPPLFELVPNQILYSSLHERALRDEITYPTSTKLFLASKNPLPSLKASHLLKLLIRFCPASEAAMKKYIVEHFGKFADIDELISTLSEPCENPAIAKEFLEDYINQPGKALLIVSRSYTTVTIRQTRYHSTYFDSRLRDEKTRYTIPIFFTIDGISNVKVFHKNESSLTIQVDESELFLMDHKIDHLYLIIYENIIDPKRNVSEIERAQLIKAVQKSMITALSIGYFKYSQMHDQLHHHVNTGLIIDDIDTHVPHSRSRDFILLRNNYTYKNEDERNYRACERRGGGVRTSWNGLFNNDTKYWELSTRTYEWESNMHCMVEWNDTALYRSFLEANFMHDNTVIRPDLMSRLPERSDWASSEWRELHRFLFRNAANFTHHRFDLLAHTVLNQIQIRFIGEYPDGSLSEDYINELRSFVIRNPKRAASMSTEIAMRLEREFIRIELPNWHNENWGSMEDKNNILWKIIFRRMGKYPNSNESD